MIENTVTAFTSIQGDQDASVDVYHAGTSTAYIAVRTGSMLTYCYNRAAQGSFLTAWADAVTRATDLPKWADHQPAETDYEHRVAAVAHTRDSLPTNVHTVLAAAARTGRPHIVVQVGHAVTHAYDRTAVHAMHAVWTLAETFAAQIFTDSPTPVEASRRKAQRRRAAQFERTGQLT